METTEELENGYDSKWILLNKHRKLRSNLVFLSRFKYEGIFELIFIQMPNKVQQLEVEDRNIY